jgi:hypothetical protein
MDRASSMHGNKKITYIETWRPFKKPRPRYNNRIKLIVCIRTTAVSGELL